MSELIKTKYFNKLNGSPKRQKVIKVLENEKLKKQKLKINCENKILWKDHQRKILKNSVSFIIIHLISLLSLNTLIIGS